MTYSVDPTSFERLTFCQNEFYTIALDLKQNNLYLELQGFWRSRDAVASYLPNLESAAQQLQPGFTLLLDLRELQTYPAEINKLFEKAQQSLLQAGLGQTAEVVKNSALQVQREVISQNTGMPTRRFESVEEAEAFLSSFRQNALG